MPHRHLWFFEPGQSQSSIDLLRMAHSAKIFFSRAIVSGD